MVISLEALAQLVVAFTNIIIALVMYKSVKEIVRDRKLRFLEKRIEYFYLPLIKYFGHGTLKRGEDARREVEEIIVSKRYLCGKKVAEVLPQHFTAEQMSTLEPYFYFEDDKEKEKWDKIANVIWDEYLEVLKEYYRFTGIMDYILPEKPEKWMFAVRRVNYI
jgi:hypothetical protein